ncbi:hypothetical protein [Nocardia brasiliensis]|uniref:hypothetical protein n=1 Tax=Nocardia brasiliensis TaxID=37326 RepID=UPI002457FB1C|nr:hypothetical protein [Nocardia brasiliensis]
MSGIDAFLASLNDFGADPEVEAALVIYTVVPVTGVLGGAAVRSGVGVEEVAPWPAAPPHWIHLSADITLRTSNIGGSPKPGWVAHSRDIQNWGAAAVPIGAWLAHVRGVLGTAV